MKAAPLLSIITITRENRDGLAVSANSLAAQTQRGFEWIVIDGASSDGTAELLINAPRPPDIFQSEPDNGIYDAMNKGMTRANGHYTLFLNAGDSLPAADTLALIYQELSHHRPDFLYGDALEQDLDGQRHYKAARNHTRAALGLFTHHQAMIYKTQILKDLCYNTDYKIAADYDLTLRFLKRAKSVHYLLAPLCIFKAGGLSQTAAHQGRAEQFTIRKNLKTVGFTKNAAIHAAQFLNWHFRQLTPNAYWFLKKSARSVDNTDNGSAPV